MVDVDVVAGQRPRRGFFRRNRWALLAWLVLLIVLATVPTVWERSLAAPYLRDPATVPNTRVALVLGARVDGNRPTAFLASRLDAAVDLFTRHKVQLILVSGNDDRHGYDEPDVMRGYLIAHGVPAAQVIADHAGFTTWDTCARARQVFGVDRAILVTQTFHVARAVALCRANGVTGYGVGIDSMSVGVVSTVYGYVREFFAADKAMWDALVTKPTG
ncbi:MAG TPA: ElyC/SanA/YdcF family protein [Pseudonocardiaceae bacterium]|nr:ElyC/SanA/YdcF family protein [Pseudonocardiaceae bacterium]